jgi:hypothetical protein
VFQTFPLDVNKYAQMNGGFNEAISDYTMVRQTQA